MGVLGEARLKQLEATFGGKERFFAGIVRDGDGDAIEEAGGAVENIEMAVSDGVERAGIDAVTHKVEGGTLAQNPASMWSSKTVQEAGRNPSPTLP